MMVYVVTDRHYSKSVHDFVTYEVLLLDTLALSLKLQFPFVNLCKSESSY